MQSIPNSDSITKTQPRPHQSKMSADLTQEVDLKRNDLKMTLEDSQVIDFMNSQNISVHVQSHMHQKSANDGENNVIDMNYPNDPYEGKVETDQLYQNDIQDQESTDSEGEDRTIHQQSQMSQPSVHQSMRQTEQTPKEATQDSIIIGSDQLKTGQTKAMMLTHGSRNTLQFINEPMNSSSQTKIINCSNEKSIMREVPTKVSLCVAPLKLSKFQNLKFEIFAWGLNNQNQLGLQTHVSPRMFGSCKKSVLIPRKLKDIQFDPEFLASGLEHTLIVSQTGELWGQGSNQQFALGLTPRQIESYSNELIKIEIPLPEQKIQAIVCGHHHTIMQLQNGQIFGCGQNSKCQLGIRNGYQAYQQFTTIPINSCNIEQISCGPFISSFLDIQNQLLFQCGQVGENTTQGIAQIDLSSEIGDESIVDIKQGHSCIMALSKLGNVFLKVEDGPFEKVHEISRVKDFAASGANYAILTQCNNIFEWNEESEAGFIQLENSFAKFTSFQSLSLGSDFGHVIDNESNLYGWGNNKNGELGTGDSYPRPKLSQIRIFNNEKQYMRCFRVFAGTNHAIAVFESNISPNGIGSNSNKGVRQGSVNSHGQRSSTYQKSPTMKPLSYLNKSQEVSYSQQKPSLPLPPHDKQYFMRRKESQSIDYSPQEVRKVQYQKTENALQKYRLQARSYRDNIQRIRHHLSNEPRQSALQANNNDLKQVKPPKAKSISPMPQGRRNKNDHIINSQFNSVNTFSFQPSANGEMPVMSNLHQNDPTLEAYKELVSSDQQMILKSKFAQKQHLTSHQFQVMSKESIQAIPLHINQNSSKQILIEDPQVSSKVQLNHRIEQQMRNSQQVLDKSKSQRSGSVAFSPPHALQVRHSHQIQNPNQVISNEKMISPNTNELVNLNFTNQRLSNQTGLLTPGSSYPQTKNNCTSNNDDTYELSQSVYPPGIGSMDMQNSSNNPYNHDLPMVDTNHQSRKSSYNNGFPNPSNIHMLQTGNTISESEQLQSIQVRGRQNHHPSFKSQSQVNQIYQTQRPVSKGYIKQENDYSPSPIAATNDKAQDHLHHNGSINDTTTNTFLNERSQIEQTVDALASTTKLNKYRRKLKKYIHRNQEQTKEIDFYKNQADEFQNQNTRIIRCSQQEEERMQSKFFAEQQQFQDFMNQTEQERLQKQQIINNLTEENVSLVNDLKDRDFKHQSLDAKMNEVHMHVADVTSHLNQYTAENRNLTLENQQLYDQMMEKDRIIRNLECDIDSFKMKQMSHQKNNDEGRDQTIAMLEQQVEELLEANKNKDHDLLEMKNKVNYLKNKRREAKTKSKDLEFTVKDLTSQLMLSQQQIKMVQYNPANSNHLSTINEIQGIQSSNERSPMKQGFGQAEQASIETYTQDENTSRQVSNRSHIVLSSNDVSSKMRNMQDQHSFENYQMNQPAYNRNMMSHTSSSRYTTTTAANKYNYGPDLQQMKKIPYSYGQAPPSAIHIPETRNHTELSGPQTTKSIERDAFKNVPHYQSNNAIFKDERSKGRIHGKHDQKLKNKQRAKSGPSDSMHENKYSQHMNQPISLRNEKDMPLNPFNQDYSHQYQQTNPFNYMPSFQMGSQPVNQNAFPNLSYVNKKYLNQNNQSYVDNAAISAVRKFNNPMSDNYTCSPGQFSQLMDSYTRNTNRQSDLPSNIMSKQPCSYNDLQNKSTQVHSGGNIAISKSITESNIMSIKQLVNYPTKTTSPAPVSRVYANPSEKQITNYGKLSDSQQKEAFDLYSQNKHACSPRKIEDLDQIKNKSKSHSNFDSMKKSGSMQSITQLPVHDSHQKSLMNNSIGLQSNNNNTVEESTPLSSTANLSYKDLIMQKMNQKVNKIENILNKKKEREVKKEVVKEENLDEPTIQSADVEKPPELSKYSSFDPIIGESTLNKLNLSAINQDSKGRRSANDVTELLGRQPYISVGNNQQESMKVNARRLDELSKLHDFQRSSKSWEQRRGKSANSSEMNKKDVITKYKEAYRDLGQELKKKISMVKKEDPQEDNEDYYNKQYN